MNRLVECRSFDVTPIQSRTLLVHYHVERVNGDGVEVRFTALTEYNDTLPGLLYGPYHTHAAIKSAISRELRCHGSRIDWI